MVRHACLNQIVVFVGEPAQQTSRRKAAHSNDVDCAQRQDETRGMSLAQIGEPAGRHSRLSVEHFEPAGDRWEEADDGLQESRLARAVGAHKGERCLATNQELDVGDHRLATVANR